MSVAPVVHGVQSIVDATRAGRSGSAGPAGDTPGKPPRVGHDHDGDHGAGASRPSTNAGQSAGGERQRVNYQA